MSLAQATQTRVKNVSFVMLKQGEIISSNQVQESYLNKVESSEKTSSRSDRAILHLMSTQETTEPILIHPQPILCSQQATLDSRFLGEAKD